MKRRLVIAAWSGWLAHASAATLFVAPGGSHTPPFTNWATAATNIAAAVTLAGPGDTVLVSNGLYAVRSLVYLGQGVRVQSVNGPEATVISGSETSGCFQIMHRDAVVDGFTLTAGRAWMGGAVFMSDGATLQNCVVTGNYSTLMGGGGVYVNLGGTISNCLIADNLALNQGDGGGVYLMRDGRLLNSTVRGNQARVGGGVAAMHYARVEATAITGNQADQGGGVLLSHRSLLADSRVQSNQALRAGGLCAFLGGSVINTDITTNQAPVDADLQVVSAEGEAPCFDGDCPTLPALVPATGDVTYYVSPAGADTNTGTASTQAFRTVQRGVDALAPGNTLHIEPGLYREYVVMRRAGAPGQPIRLVGGGTRQASLRGSSPVTSWVHHADNVWKIADWPLPPQQVFQDGTNLVRLGWPNLYLQQNPFTYTPVGYTLDDLGEGGFLYDVTNRVLYVHLHGGADPRTRAMEVAARVQVLDAASVAWIHLVNLRFEHANTFSYSPGGWSLVRLSPYGVLEDSPVTASDGEGLSMNDNCRVERSEISNHGMSGLNMGTNGIIRDSRVVSNTYRPFNTDWSSGGLRVIPGFCAGGRGASGGVVENCEVAWNRGYGIWFDQCTGDVPRIVRNNYVHHNLRAGIMFEISRGGDIYNNLCVSNQGGGLWISGSDQIRAWNNTLAHNSGYIDLFIYGIPRVMCDPGGAPVYASVISNQVLNNIVYDSRCDFDLGMLPVNTSATQAAYGNRLDHNLFFRPGDSPRLSLSAMAWYNSVTGWHAATGWEGNGVQTDPLLGPDFLPAANSPAVDRGAAGAPDRDRVGLPRPLDGDLDGVARPDLGARELLRAEADSDRDGMTDGDELRAGTHPADSGSVLRALLVPPGSGSEGAVTWPGVTQRIYRLALTTNLHEPFVAWQTNLPAQLPLTGITLSNAALPQAFFRVELESP